MAVSAGVIVSLAGKPIQYGRILYFGVDKVRRVSEDCCQARTLRLQVGVRCSFSLVPCLYYADACADLAAHPLQVPSVFETSVQGKRA